jgi:hypothetical protein
MCHATPMNRLNEASRENLTLIPGQRRPPKDSSVSLFCEGDIAVHRLLSVPVEVKCE